MAFKRRKRKVITLEFEGTNGEVLKYEVPHSKELGDKLIALSETQDLDDATEKEQIEFLYKAYEEILGKGEMKKIQEKIYDGDEFLLTDMLDIGNYIIEQVDKANDEIISDYGVSQNQANNNANDNNKLFTIEEVQRLLNDRTSELSH